MKAIYKREMNAFFTTPMGYVFLAAFLLVMNLLFYISNIVGKYADITPLFPVILIVMMVLTPTLTMRLFSEEFKYKTDQLLFTAPVSARAIVIGKFLAALTVYGIAVCCTAPWPVIVSFFVNLNTSEIIGSYIGVILAGAAFISLGAFVSSLTESQIVAAIATFAAFLAVYLIDMATEYINVDWINRIINWFSLFSRFDYVSRGLLSLEDLMYYASFSVVFLFLTEKTLQNRRWL